MPRIPRVRGLSSLQTAVAPSSVSNRLPLAARATTSVASQFSTSAQAHGKNTDWIRGKLWKGEAPGPEDPYTQRMEPEDVSNLPEETRDLQARADTYALPEAVEQSRLVLPPRRTEAVPEHELSRVDPSYVPATDLADLDEIKPVSTWWQQPGHWGPESHFRAFAAPKVEDRAVVEICMRRAVVESLALQEAGLLEEWAAKKWPAGERAELDQTLAVEVVVEDGKATLKGDTAAITGRLTSEVEESELTAELAGKSDAMQFVKEAQEIVKALDASWKDVALTDHHLKFAIRKRIYQLTGRLIPDSKLGAARTAQHLLTLTVNPAKRSGKKLAELLATQGDLPALPNVTVHRKKVGAIDKEVAVGRWKVITEELTKRGLPVTGTAGLGKNKERDWLTGKV
ncbi:hypothetical protein EDB81DRAFT_874644 [Dactylonectria macrodidyma]|uniref:Large ribosomal subunit protein mL50 n=1 Tax=Dactylonectria macrodidyma TaxID=307937 RepID=A0A9P9FTA1_9HYPO|nr:hypothetical protein EDB81DRAFT_874644 [Dactylonectria macrodidyma]